MCHNIFVTHFCFSMFTSNLKIYFGGLERELFSFLEVGSKQKINEKKGSRDEKKNEILIAFINFEFWVKNWNKRVSYNMED